MGAVRIAGSGPLGGIGSAGQVGVVAGVFGMKRAGAPRYVWLATEYSQTLAAMGHGCARAPSRQRGSRVGTAAWSVRPTTAALNSIRLRTLSNQRLERRDTAA